MKIQNIHQYSNLKHSPSVTAKWLSVGKLKAGFCTLLLLAALSGCKKDLNLVPEDNISDATFYKTAADYKLAANVLYQGLDQWGTEDTQSDIAFNNPNSVSNGQLLPTETTSWSGLYTNIRYANNIIDKGAASTDAGIKQYVAEAKFFRAYYYYKLFRLYGGVPLISKVLQTGDDALFAPRSTMTQTADFILADLNAAKTDLPLQTSGGDVGRITKGIALGLAARVALFEGTWLKFRGEASANTYLDAAIAASQEVINGGVYALYIGNGAQSYRYLFLEAGDDSKETMLDRRYARNIFGHDVPYAYDQDGYNPTRKMADLYLDKNGLPITSPGTVFQGYQTFVSEYQDRDPRMTMTMIIPGTLTNRVFNSVTKIANWPDNPQRNFNTGYILYKYMSEDPAANNSGRLGTSSLFDFDKHIMRYAEVLLSYAEAVYEKNGAISDLDLDLTINKIRARVGMPRLTNAFVNANGLNMRTEIRRERTVELSLEGFRYDDLRRWKTAETELPQDIKGIKITGTQWATRTPYSNATYLTKVDASGFLIAETGRKFNPARDYLQPLPLREIAFYANSGKKLDQNPGW